MSHTTWRTTTPTFRSKVFETLLCARKKAVVGGADPELDKGIGSGKTAHEVIEDYKYQKRQTMDGELSILGSGRSLKQKQSQKGKKNPKKGEDEEVTSSKASGNTTRTKYRTESEEQDYKWLFSPWNNQNQTNQDGEEVKKEKDKPNETVDSLEPKRATEALTQEQMKTGAVNSSKKKILQSNPDKHSLKREKKIDLLLTKTDQVSFPVENITNDTEKEKTPSSPSEEEIAEIPEDAEALYQEQQSIGKRSSKEPLSKKIENKVEKLLIGTGIKNTKSTNTTNANSTYKPVSNSDKDDKDSRKHSVQTSQNSHSLENNEALTLKKGISFRKSMRSSFDATKVMKEEDIDRLLKDDDETKPDTMISRVSGKLKVATKKKTRGSTSSGEETDDEEFHKFMSEVKKDELLKPPTLFTSKRLI